MAAGEEWCLAPARVERTIMGARNAEHNIQGRTLRRRKCEASTSSWRICRSPRGGRSQCTCTTNKNCRVSRVEKRSRTLRRVPNEPFGATLCAVSHARPRNHHPHDKNECQSTHVTPIARKLPHTKPTEP